MGNKTILADVWHEEFPLPLTKFKIKYDYFITTNGTDTITHRIDFDGNVSGSIGAILYGDFEVQHDIESFRSVFEPPAECLKPNTLKCTSEHVEKWNTVHSKLFL